MPSSFFKQKIKRWKKYDTESERQNFFHFHLVQFSFVYIRFHFHLVQFRFEFCIYMIYLFLYFQEIPNSFIAMSFPPLPKYGLVIFKCFFTKIVCVKTFMYQAPSILKESYFYKNKTVPFIYMACNLQFIVIYLSVNLFQYVSTYFKNYN